jgi:hypothetical protein
MLTKREEDFIHYWENQRLQKKKFLRKISIGLPLGVFVVMALIINFFSGWYKKADMELHANGSVIIVVLVASIAIVLFIVIFSARFKWEQNEQFYKELLAKKDTPVQQVSQKSGQ